MLSELRGLLGFIVGVLLLFAAIGAGVALAINMHTEYQCSQYQEITSKPVRYSSYDTCYIKHDGQWRRWDEYKAIQREHVLKETP